MLHEVASHAMRGFGVGGFVGLALGAGTALVNAVMFEKVAPLTYRDGEGNPIEFRDIARFGKGVDIEPSLRTLMKYRRYHPESYDAGCALTQRLADLERQFSETREGGGDAAAVVALYYKTAMRADRRWRRLFGAAGDARDVIGQREAKEAAMALHVAYEEVLADMRTRFQTDPQLSGEES